MCSRLVSLVCLVIASLALAPLDAHATPRVDPAVWEALEAQGEVEVILLGRVQADWTDLAQEVFPDHLARRRAVVERLRGIAHEEQASVLTLLEEAGAPHRRFVVVNAVGAHVDASLLASLVQLPELAAVLPNVRSIAGWLDGASRAPAGGGTADDVAGAGGEGRLEPTLPELRGPDGAEPGLVTTGATELWARGYTGEGLVVGVMDSGMQWDHEALRSNYRGSQGPGVDHDYNWHDAIHDSVDNPCGNDSPEPCDDYGHGTHVTGTVVGTDFRSNQVGMAPGAHWIGCRGFDDGTGATLDLLECFDFFLAPYPQGGGPMDGDPALAPDLTNHSWACPPDYPGCEPEMFRSALAAHRAAGILTVVAAGNRGPWCGTIRTFPGSESEVFTIGAVDHSDVPAYFSGRGPVPETGLLKPDLVAPGVQVRSSTLGSGRDYENRNGTSMATPHVSGGVALLWSAVPSLRGRIDETIELLQRTAYREIVADGCGGNPIHGPNATWGHGRLDLVQALDHATSPPTEMACDDGLDDDGDRFVDCADPDCIGDPACPETGNCDDGVDNDLDGQLDCADSDCLGDPACPEAGNCDDGVDNDLDGQLDCADSDCLGDPACPEDGNCDDGVDNDLDGQVDCIDSDCQGDPACPEVGNCDDGVDNDLDGQVDCTDVDCLGDPACPEMGRCDDGLDNDLDGQVDCADDDCSGDPACPEAGRCDDGLDNDLDGQVDCADVDCQGDPACPEAGHCGDDIDNDLDGLVDCADPDCLGDSACSEAGSCDDGVDNDLDGPVDCLDPDCVGDPSCPELGDCADGLDNDLDGLTDCADDECFGRSECPVLLVNRSVVSGPGGPVPPIATVFSEACRTLPSGPCSEEILEASGLELTLEDEIASGSVGTLGFYWHSGEVELRLAVSGEDLVVTWR
ncbi:MAG: S8 family serine peptidase [Acidobacteriota bacterium]